MRLFTAKLPMLAVLGGLLLAQPAFAGLPLDAGTLLPRGGSHDSGGQVDTRLQMTPRDAARRAQQEFGGKVLNVSPAPNGYRVKLIREGNVRVVFIPDS